MVIQEVCLVREYDAGVYKFLKKGRMEQDQRGVQAKIWRLQREIEKDPKTEERNQKKIKSLDKSVKSYDKKIKGIEKSLRKQGKMLDIDREVCFAFVMFCKSG